MIYTIEKKPYGLRVAFDGMMDAETAKKFAREFMQILAGIDRRLGILIDLTRARPMPPESQAPVNECYKAAIKKGVTRSASVVPSPLMKMQMVRLSKEHGTYDKERYIDSTANPNWESIALDWIERGIDPEL